MSISMIAIPTNILKFLKEKFIPIGQNNGGAQGTGATNNANQQNFNKEAENAATALLNAGKAALTYSDNIAALNIGLAGGSKIQSDLNTTIRETTELITLFEQRESKLTSTFGAGTAELARRRKAFTDIQKGIKATDGQMTAYRITMEANAELYGKAFADLASNGAASAKAMIKEQMASFDYLSKNTDMTAESQASLQLYAAGAGRSIGQQVELVREMSGQLKGTIDKSKTFEVIQSGIASLSSEVRMQYNKIPGSLEMAVLKSKQLGMKMEQLHNTGKSLLDIESSVGKELEYQLLSGKRLVDQNGKSLTNAYRQATLEGDSNKQADIMKNILTSQGDILKGNNFLAKQALADSLGMTVQDLMYMKEKEAMQDRINEQIEASRDTLKDANIDLEDIDKTLSDPKLKAEFVAKVQAIGDTDANKIIELLDKAATEEESRKDPATRTFELLQSGIDVRINQNIGTPEQLKEQRDAAKKYANTRMTTAEFAQTKAFQQQFGAQELRARAIADTEQAIIGLTEKIPLFGAAIGKLTKKITDATKLATGGKTGGLKAGEIVSDNTTISAGPNANVKDGIVQTTDGGTISFDKRDKISIVASPYGTMNDAVAEKVAAGNVVATPTNVNNNQISGQVNTQQSFDMSSIATMLEKIINRPQPIPQAPDINNIVKAIEQAFKNINLDVNVGIDPMAIDKEIKFRSGNLRSNIT